jgi:hypothetical protein
VLRTHTDRSLHGRVDVLQREITRSQSRSAYEQLEEMVMATVRIGEHVQTMCRQAAAVDLAEKSAIAIANW